MAQATAHPVLSRRAAEALDVAATLLAEAGRDGLTMRALAERIGIRAPSLYKHFQSKEQIEQALVERGTEELRGILVVARRAPDPVSAIVVEVVRFATDHPHLFDLLAERPLATALAEAAPERALLVYVQGMVALERDPATNSADAARVWNYGLAAFRALSGPPARTVVSSVRGPD